MRRRPLPQPGCLPPPREPAQVGMSRLLDMLVPSSPLLTPPKDNLEKVLPTPHLCPATPVWRVPAHVSPPHCSPAGLALPCSACSQFPPTPARATSHEALIHFSAATERVSMRAPCNGEARKTERCPAREAHWKPRRNSECRPSVPAQGKQECGAWPQAPLALGCELDSALRAAQ